MRGSTKLERKVKLLRQIIQPFGDLLSLRSIKVEAIPPSMVLQELLRVRESNT